MAQYDKKKTNIPPSLQPRKKVRKSIPNTVQKAKKATPPKPKPVKKEVVEPTYSVNDEKERFTLWLSKDTYKAFKIHTATRKGSGSNYIEDLINKDLGIK
jgi:hypothetical protein